MLTERSGRVREAHKLLRRPAREKAGLFLAEGPQAVREAVAAGPGRVVELFATTAAAVRWAPIVAAASDAGVPVSMADEAALAALSETVTPQGLVALCRSLTVDLAAALAGEAAGEPAGGPQLVAVLAEARDPGNAGTVIRCADAAGADAVVLTHGSADPQGGKAVRASAGSVFHLPIVSGPPVADAVTALRERGLTVLAADGAGSLDLDAAEDDGLLAGPVAWLFGNEAWGLPDDVAAVADHVVRVPIYGRAESLNLATAAAVCLYGSARARRRAAR
ncbi:TrmH family RNA methyltransferase [Jiangella anatolica]|uniref:RNA methyltransferase n=1 Tax=Jiangella anatolica TaxID=2670374 RepID=A0A2W2CPT0_9ACTN|nr:RNA methyltransferase [Jiangella anatolica]PZF82233.1 RNA methyltransferase [Jiangella anatolica]